MTPSNANTSGLEVVAFLLFNEHGHTKASTMPPADGGDVAAYEPLVTAASAQTRIAELEAERDEADRRAGAAERLLEDRTDRIAKRERWLRDAKEARGYHQNVSFDRVWADTCAAADRAALQQEG